MSQTAMHDYANDLEVLRSAAVSAGIMAMGYFKRDIEIWSKENASPVTEADYAVDELLASTLLGARPDYGWLSEETADDFVRLQKQRTFIVDPIDGTRGFIRGDDRWTICLSVVENGTTVAGVVYAPVRNELYEAIQGGTAKLNGQILKTPKLSARVPIIPAPAAVHKEMMELGLDRVHGPAIPSLAYRLIQVATGNIDAAITRGGAQDWDISAASCILNACALTLEDVCVGAPVYNNKIVVHGPLAVMRDRSMQPVIHRALKNVYGCPNPVQPQNSEQ